MEQIKDRYNKLAGSSCGLSCGDNLSFANIEPGENCLDLGCGRGSELLRMAKIAGNRGKAIGIDISPEMIRVVKQKIAEDGFENVELHCSELSVLPVEDSSVDLVISNCVLNHISKKDLIWHEIHRVLKPGGRFVISDIYSLEIIPEPWCSDQTAIAECWAGAQTKEVYMNIISDSGFGDVEILKESSSYKKGIADIVSFTVRGIKK